MRIWLFFGLGLVAVLVALFAPPIPQNPEYHHFADIRTFLRIPNFWNVVSNIPFLVVGCYGVWAWRRAQWEHPADQRAWLVVALAGFLIGPGSAYYHWDPNNLTLFWDRLPMTLAFMGVFSAVISERVSMRAGWFLLGPFLALGIASVEYWRRSELAGHGDLRLYALVQFYPMAAIPLMMWLFRSRYSGSERVWWMVIWYVAAKLLEAFDPEIYRFTGHAMSGHALKHAAAAIALWMPLKMLVERTPKSSVPLEGGSCEN